MKMEVFKANELFNLDLRTLEDRIYYVNLGWIELWVHPSLVRDGKITFPLKNCNVFKTGGSLIISEGSYNLHYIKFSDRVIKDVYGLSIIEYFMSENQTEVMIVSSRGDDIFLKTEQVLDISLAPIPVKDIYVNSDENLDEDEDY